MELTAQSASHPKLPSCSTPLSPSFLCSKASSFSSKSVIPFHSSKNHNTQLKFVRIKERKQRNVGVVFASEGESTSTDVVERWLLEPVGDGDSRHLGYKVEMPGAIEIVSSEVTVGRLPDKADVVIPVSTVSGVHARIQKKGGSLLVTDLDSTNGTFIDDRKLKPGVVSTVPSGSLLTFGDIHLAKFRVSKLENEGATSKQEESAEKSD
ncbi:hypothetical protein SLA2020_337160 [Shorea laevis]